MNHHRRPQPQNQNDDVPPFLEPIIEYYNALPPVTKAWFTLSLLVTGLHTLDVFETNQLILLWDRVLPPHLELWRIVTSFAWAGPGTLVDFPVLMVLYSIAVTIPGYESDPHDACNLEPRNDPSPQQGASSPGDGDGRDMRDAIINQWIPRRPVHRKSDCFFAMMVCTITILATYLIVMETPSVTEMMHLLVPIPQPFLLPIFTRTLLYSIITLNSLKHPDQQQNINFFPVPGRYVPVFHVVFGLMMGYRVNETVHGILVGLTYAFLIQEGGALASLLGRKRLIFTPRWLIHLMAEEGMYGEVISEGMVNDSQASANSPYPGIRLEPGSNFLHHSAAIGDESYVRSQVDRVYSAPSTSEIARAAAPFHQSDRNGWQPLHEAARAGHLNVLALLLEVDDVQNQPNGNNATWRRRAGMLKVNVNARTNGGVGTTALRLVEENHGENHECASLLRQVGGVSLGFGDDTIEE